MAQNRSPLKSYQQRQKQAYGIDDDNMIQQAQVQARGGGAANVAQNLPFFDIFNPRSSNAIIGRLPGNVKVSELAISPSNQNGDKLKFSLFPRGANGSYSQSVANSMMEKYMNGLSQFLDVANAAIQNADKKNKKLVQAQQDRKAKKIYKKSVQQLNDQFQDKDRIFQTGKAISQVLGQVSGLRNRSLINYLQQFDGDPYMKLAKGLVAKVIKIPKGNKSIGQQQLDAVQASLSVIAHDQANLEKLARQGSAKLTQSLQKLQEVMKQFVAPIAVANSGLQKQMVKYDSAVPSARSLLDSSKILNNWTEGLGQAVQRGIKPNAMASFPQWMFSQIQANKKKRQSGYMSVLAAKRMTDQADPVLISMANLDPTLAKWDTTKKVWTGSWAQQQELRALKRGDKYDRAMQKANEMMSTSYTLQQIQDKVPKFIIELVAANASITGETMGPMTPDGFGLFAGRWVDPVTGKVRMLPNATQKYVNPFVRQQKVSFLQARILNKWNELMTSYQQYNHFLTKRNYTQNQLKKLKNGLNPVQNAITANRKINKTIQSYWGAFPNPSNMRWLILNTVGNTKLSKVYAMPYPQTEVKKIRNPTLTEQQQKLGAERVESWRQIINEGGQTVQTKINASSQSDLVKSKLLLRLQQTLVGLLSVGGQGKGALKMLMRGALIPANGSVSTMLKAKQSLDSMSQLTKSYQMGIGQLRGQGSYDYSNDLWAKKIYPSIKASLKGNAAEPSDIRNFMNLVGKTNGANNRLDQASQLMQFIKARPLKEAMLQIAGPTVQGLAQPYMAAYKKHSGANFI